MILRSGRRGPEFNSRLAPPALFAFLFFLSISRWLYAETVLALVCGSTNKMEQFSYLKLDHEIQPRSRFSLPVLYGQ